MKIKQLFLGIAILASVTFIVSLNQNVASAQSTQSNGDCGLIIWPHESSEADNVTSTSCGKCTVYHITPGWKEGDDISTKYYSEEVTIKGDVVTCRDDSNLPRTSSCNEAALDGTINCPPEPSDLDYSQTGTSGTGTQSSTNTL